MRGNTQLAAVLAATMLVGIPTASAQVPTAMNFAGRVADADGPVDGSVDLEFAIYDGATGGTQLWSEVHEGVSADQGLVHATLGSTTPLDSSVVTGASLYLEVTVNGDVMEPRVALVSVPYALRAAVADTAETLGDLAPGDVAEADHTHHPELNLSCQERTATSTDNGGLSVASVSADCFSGETVTGGGCSIRNAAGNRDLISSERGFGSWRCSGTAESSFDLRAHAVCCEIR